MSFARRALLAVLAAALTAALPPAGVAPAHADTLQAGFTRLAGTIPAQIGIALAPAGGLGATQLGPLQNGVAWSTMKVPLAIAATRAGTPNAQALATRAITASDNDAAEQLWSSLGAPAQAAQQVQAVLRQGGDGGTAVQSQRVRPGFTAFGQSQWPLARQAVFAGHLQCIPGAQPVLAMMQNTVADQRWGLASLGVPSKGGWGPGTSGGYLVRQLGLVHAPSGDLGVALAALPNDGKFESGVAALNQMTQWLSANAGALPGGRCG